MRALLGILVVFGGGWLLRGLKGNRKRIIAEIMDNDEATAFTDWSRP